jgi:hypothetical protein
VPEDIKIKGFVIPYAHDCRKRHQHHRYRNEIVEFVVQLEILVKGMWHPIIRYDTAHGFAHCDIIHYSGKIEKVRMPTLNYKEALTYADEDLNENWQVYRNRYLKEVPNE